MTRKRGCLNKRNPSCEKESEKKLVPARQNYSVVAIFLFVSEVRDFDATKAYVREQNTRRKKQIFTYLCRCYCVRWFFQVATKLDWTLMTKRPVESMRKLSLIGNQMLRPLVAGNADVDDAIWSRRRYWSMTHQQPKLPAIVAAVAIEYLKD